MGRLISLSTMREVVAPDVGIGQMVRYTGDMANRSGIGAVIAIREPSAYSGKSYDVALADGREFKATMLDESRWEIMDETAIGETLDILRAGVAAKAATEAAAASSAAQEIERIKAKIAADHPHLLQSDKGGSLTQAAKNIRIELRRAYPGVKFSVTTERYSGGNSCNIDWTDGPNAEQVEKITNKYSGGHFDGMTDSYEHSRSPWVDVFGQAKYVHCNRHYSDKMVESVLRRVAAHLGGLEQELTVSDYRKGLLWNVKNSGGCDVSREVNAALSRHTYAIAKVQS